MQPIRAKHTPSETDVTIVQIIMKGNDVLVVYIDADGALAYDEYENFNPVIDTHRPA
jgi:hypothetical protein